MKTFLEHFQNKHGSNFYPYLQRNIVSFPMRINGVPSSDSNLNILCKRHATFSSEYGQGSTNCIITQESEYTVLRAEGVEYNIALPLGSYEQLSKLLLERLRDEASWKHGWSRISTRNAK